MLLLQQMIVLFILMLIGYYVNKKGFVTDATFKQLSWIVVYVACPAMVISGSVNSGKMIQGTELFATLGLAIGLYVVLILIAFVTPYLRGVPKEISLSEQSLRTGCFAICCIVSDSVQCTYLYLWNSCP